MIKRIKNGILLFLLINMCLYFKTENNKLVLLLILLMSIFIGLEIYMIFKEKEYRTYKALMVINLVVGIVYIMLFIIYFMQSNPTDKFIITTIASILMISREYLMSEKFKISKDINDNNI